MATVTLQRYFLKVTYHYHPSLEAVEQAARRFNCYHTSFLFKFISFLSFFLSFFCSYYSNMELIFHVRLAPCINRRGAERKVMDEQIIV